MLEWSLVAGRLPLDNRPGWPRAACRRQGWHLRAPAGELGTSGRPLPLRASSETVRRRPRAYTGLVSTPDPDVTALLLRWTEGDRRALDDLTPLLYKDLRRLARDVLSREQAGHTLSATALVHEAYLRLVDQRRVRWDGRAHFFGAAAHVMRRVLVDHARAKAAAKRGGAATRTVLEDDMAMIGPLAEEILDLDAALDRLAAIDDRKVRVVEMKVLAGMTNQEVAAALDISDATVERDWAFARAWLINELGQPAATP